MSSHLKTDVDVFVPTQKDVEIFEMISMIIRKNLPVGIVEDEDYRLVNCFVVTAKMT